ncbi:MAG: murein biosynthesis integral membrane protein MurJ [Gemmatimonadota bacterium]
MASGILLSRILGVVRQRALAHYFGIHGAADAFIAAFRIPNVLQNLFGEGVLSASFIPVYARLRAEGREDEARRVANAVFAILALVTSLLVLVGVLGAGPLTRVIAPGFDGPKRDLTVRLVRILFPGSGLLVLSAWCLGVLNSHRRFFLSYTAPVVWNVAIIAALLGFGSRMEPYPLAEVAAWGSVIGSALQFGIQLPTVLRVLGGFRPVLDTTSVHVRTVVRNFIPVFIGRGVVQLSAFADTIIASLLPEGAVAALGNAQVLYTLPVSLFGMAVSAAELPEMSSATGDTASVGVYLQGRLNAGLRRIAFFVVPSAAAFLAFGGVIAGAVYQSGRFQRADSEYVWVILAGSAVGLLASTLGRLYSSTYYALHDTRTPLRYAMIRVGLTIVLGVLFAIPLPHLLGIGSRWGAAGLTASAGIAGWVEFFLLRRTLNRRLGDTGLETAYQIRLWAAALLGAVFGLGVERLLPAVHPIVEALFVLGAFGGVYLAVTLLLRVPEARALLARAGRGGR